LTKPDGPLSGRYVLRRQLGAGGSARVFEADDLKLGRIVAIKTLAPQFVTMPDAIRRLEREGRVAGAIAHPNVCALTDIGRLASGAPFLVFERLVGETLATKLARQRPIAVDQTMRIAEQILAGLQAAHELGIVHRDLKPDNVFIVELAPGMPLVKLLDFGTAQVPGLDSPDGEQLTSTGYVVGTAEYMAPEQVRGLRDFDARTDIYACGVVLYEMLSGSRPFAERSEAELLHAIAHQKPRPLAELAPRVPRAIARAIDVALAIHRDRRHADVAAFLMALRSPHAPPPTGATSVLTARAGATLPEGDDWDMQTRESGPPQAMMADIVIEGDPGAGPEPDAESHPAADPESTTLPAGRRPKK
jgi:serine/threonine-protein kinase